MEKINLSTDWGNNPYWEAKLVPALRKGKTKAYKKPKRQDVPDAIIDRTLPYLLPTIRDMVQVQRLASMRPSEVFRMKPGEAAYRINYPACNSA